MSLKDKLLTKINAPRKLMPVTFLGESMFIREMNAAERDDFDADQLMRMRATNGDEVRSFRARFLVKCLADESGTLLFSDDEADALAKASAKELRSVYEQSQKLNALTAEDEKEALKKSPDDNPSA